MLSYECLSLSHSHLLNVTTCVASENTNRRESE